VPGRFTLDVAGLDVTVPQVVRVTAEGIRLAYDPTYDPATHGGQAQELFSISKATLSFDRFGVSGSITPFVRDDGTPIPGLVVRSDGFRLGEVLLAYNPGGALPSGAEELKNPSGGKIRLGNVLEFDDLQIGITDFGVTFGVGVDFNGDVFVATSGAKFFPDS